MNSSPDSRQSLLHQLERLTSLERGTLAQEYRERPAADGEGTVRRGPYYKHQCWEEGRNLSRRVPVAEVEALREDLENAKHFDQITSQLESMAIANGRARRVAAAGSAQPESKKNSRTRRSPSVTGKSKPSSSKSRSGSRAKE